MFRFLSWWTCVVRCSKASQLVGFKSRSRVCSWPSASPSTSCREEREISVRSHGLKIHYSVEIMTVVSFTFPRPDEVQVTLMLWRKALGPPFSPLTRCLSKNWNRFHIVQSNATLLWRWGIDWVRWQSLPSTPRYGHTWEGGRQEGRLQ